MQEPLTSYNNVAFKRKTAIRKFTDDYENRLVSDENIGAFISTLLRSFALNHQLALCKIKTA